MNIRYRVELSEEERGALEALLSGGKHAVRKLKRAQILLVTSCGCACAPCSPGPARCAGGPASRLLALWSCDAEPAAHLEPFISMLI